jgi:hypothetical protein
VAVPERRNTAGFAFSDEGVASSGDDPGGISANEHVCSFGDGDRPLGVFAESEAGDTKGCGFLLDASGIGEDKRGFAEQAKKVEIANGWDEAKLRVRLDACLGQMLLGAGMHGKDDGHFRGDGIDGSEELAEFLRGVDIRRAMESENAEASPADAILEAEIGADSGFLGHGQEMAKGIDHDVADKMDGFARAAFFEELNDSIFFGDEEIVGDGIGEDAVDFFGHGAIETAETGFDVSDGNAEFYRGKGDGDGGIDVADDEYKVGLAFEENGFDTPQDFGGLRSVGAGADFEIDMGGGDAHLAEENVGKLFVVVLTRMDEDGVDFGMAVHFAHERRDFGEIGAGADDIQDFEALGHERFVLGFKAQYSIGKKGIQRGLLAIRAKKALVRCKGVRIPRKPA